MFRDDEVLVAAKQLVIFDGIDYVTEFDEVEYFHFLFDQHEIVLANGVQAESLFTGPEALKSVSEAGRAEILTLFPELQDLDYKARPARLIPTGRQGRQLADRHIENQRPLYEI